MKVKRYLALEIALQSCL